MSDPTCEQRIDGELESIAADLTAFMENPEGTAESGPFVEYALGVDYVEPYTFTDQAEGYVRYQMSWGGPSDEIRIFGDGRIEYWFMDWFDGAHRTITHEPWAQWLRSTLEELGFAA